MTPTKRNTDVETPAQSGISPGKEQADLESAFQSSTGFANAYGEKLSPEDDEFDFGVEEFDGEAEDGEAVDSEEIKKSFRH